ncbi:MAG: TatD family hydrolase [Candidatus Margulisiibacteriota bacterium]|jgi:TatD DNase family protein
MVFFTEDLSIEKQCFATDTHAHLFLLKSSLEAVIARAKLAQVECIVNVGFCLATSIKAYEMAMQYPDNIFPAIGIHPEECASENDLDAIPEIIKKTNNSVVKYKAIGEIGLDYFRNTHEKGLQKKFFIRQLEYAEEFNLPVIIHNREADQDVLEILKDFSQIPKVFHCYSSNLDFAIKAQAENHYFSFTGNITYKNKDHILEVVKFLPLEKIMLETDCPYITPHNLKGQENEPAFVIEIARKIAEVKQLSLEFVLEQTTKNAKFFFRFK